MIVAPLLVYSYVTVNSATLEVGKWIRSVATSGGSVAFEADLAVVSQRSVSQWSLLGFTIQDPAFSLTADQITLNSSTLESGICCYGPNGYRLNFWTNDSSIVGLLNNASTNLVTLTMTAIIHADLYVQQSAFSTSENVPVCVVSWCSRVVFIDYPSWPLLPGVLVVAGGEIVVLILGTWLFFHIRRRKVRGKPGSVSAKEESVLNG